LPLLQASAILLLFHWDLGSEAINQQSVQILKDKQIKGRENRKKEPKKK
jgi:hypothetical protein